jgi:hypothetical protein
VPLIDLAVIMSAEDAYAKIGASASLVQLHTALVFAVRALIGQIKSGVVSLVHHDGFDRRSGQEAAQGAVPVRQPIKSTQAAIPGNPVREVCLASI